MSIATKYFGRYKATIEPNTDREGVDCFVEHGRYSASLACAQFEGELTHDRTEETKPIPESASDAIFKWAQTYGY